MPQINPAKSGSLHPALLHGCALRVHGVVELVRSVRRSREDLSASRERIILGNGREAEQQCRRLTRRKSKRIPRRRLGTGAIRLDGARLTIDQSAMKGILGVRRPVVVRTGPGVGLVLRDPQVACLGGVPVVHARAGDGRRSPRSIRCRGRTDRCEGVSGMSHIGPLAYPHDHVLRNHKVGSTCSRAGSGPRLVTVTGRRCRRQRPLRTQHRCRRSDRSRRHRCRSARTPGRRRPRITFSSRSSS